MKALLTLLVLAAAGWFGYRHFADAQPTFGVNNTRVIGDFEPIDDYLRAQQMKVSQGKANDFGDRFSGRDDVLVDRFERDGEVVLTVRAQSGKLLGVSCSFKSGNPDYSHEGSPVTRFAAYYWENVCDGRPEFVSKDGELVAEKDVDRASCVWFKDTSRGRVQVRDELTVLMGKAMLRPSRY